MHFCARPSAIRGRRYRVLPRLETRARPPPTVAEDARSVGDRHRSFAGRRQTRRAWGRDDERPLLGRFEVIGHLGSGGFGIVVRARDLLLGREVALKVPLPERMMSAADSSRFLKEARSAGRLDHPNIVRVYDAGELGPLGYYIASEFCCGPNLRRWINTQSGPVAFRLAARLVAALAGAVQHAHDRGILHRDIKPDNVILAGGPEPDDLVPRLTDFGLAKLLEETGNETRSEARLGTPHYMAPEQAAGRHREVGPATDVYALGATLYEILTGRPPFRGETDAETLRLVLETEPVALRLLRPGLPRDLETICLKCLCKAPAARYVSGGALVLDLTRFLDGRPIEGRPISRSKRAMAWARRRPAVAAMLALVVLMAGTLVGGIAAWAHWVEWHNTQLEIEVARADRQTREAEKQRRIAEDGRRLAERHGYADGLRMARQAILARQPELAQEILHDIRSGSDGVDQRGFAWNYLWRQSNREFTQLWGHESRISGSVLAANGSMLAGCDSRGRTVIWDLAQRGVIERPRTVLTPSVKCTEHIGFSPDGRLFVAVPEEPSGLSLGILDQAAGQPVVRLDCGQCQWIGTIRFDEQSQRTAALVVRRDGKRWILWWNIADGQRLPHSLAHSRSNRVLRDVSVESPCSCDTKRPCTARRSLHERGLRCACGASAGRGPALRVFGRWTGFRGSRTERQYDSLGHTFRPRAWRPARY